MLLYKNRTYPQGIGSVSLLAGLFNTVKRGNGRGKAKEKEEKVHRAAPFCCTWKKPCKILKNYIRKSCLFQVVAPITYIRPAWAARARNPGIK